MPDYVHFQPVKSFPELENHELLQNAYFSQTWQTGGHVMVDVYRDNETGEWYTVTWDCIIKWQSMTFDDFCDAVSEYHENRIVDTVYLNEVTNV